MRARQNTLSTGRVGSPGRSTTGGTLSPLPTPSDPGVPQDLVVSAVGQTTVDLAWTASVPGDDPIDYYEVRKGGVYLAQVNAPTVTYQATGLDPDTQYNFDVRAVDTSARTSAYSIPVNPTTDPDISAPTVPTGLTLDQVTGSSIRATWVASTDDFGVDRYEVEITAPPGQNAVVRTVNAPTVTHTETDLDDATLYQFRVRALDAADNPSAYTAGEQDTTLDVTAPAQVTGLVVDTPTSSTLDLAWDAATDNVAVTAYIVERNGVDVQTLGAVTSWQDTGLDPSTAYTYTVRARDAALNEGAKSASVGETTSAPSGAATLSDPLAWTEYNDYAMMVVNTDKKAGSIYFLGTTSGTPPTAATIKAGGARGQDFAVQGVGMLYARIDGFDDATQYWIHAVQNDGTDSNIVTGGPFTMASANAEIYVATTGNDTTGDGSSGLPYLTIQKAITEMSGGDWVIVKDGTYLDGDNHIWGVPSGTVTKRSRIIAENPGEAIIRNTAPLQSTWYQISTESGKSYIDVDGFICDHIDSTDPAYTVFINGTRNRVFRSIIRREGEQDQYGGWIRLEGEECLAEEVYGVGNYRYGFITGGTASDEVDNVFRRCVGRADYSASTQPKATFCMYGNNSGWDATRHSYLNCIALDGKPGNNTSEATYGAWYLPKNASYVELFGCISLNMETTWAGMFLQEQSGGNIDAQHCAIIDTSGNVNTDGLRIGGSAGPFDGDHLTITDNPYAYQQSSSGTRNLHNTVFIGNAEHEYASGFGWTNQSYCAFDDAADSEGTNPVTSNVQLTYPVRAEAGSGQKGAASDGGDIGAEILYQYGIPGSIRTDTDSRTLTAMPLWPDGYSLEDKYQEVCRWTNDPSGISGVWPESNDEDRGFCQTGNDAWGRPFTLTRYIWQYFGNERPNDYYA